MLVPGAMTATLAASSRKKPALAARPAAGGDVGDDGDAARRRFFRDLAGGIHEAAGSVEAQQNGRGVIRGGLVEGVADDFDGDGADHAIDVDGEDARALAMPPKARRRPQGQEE